MHSKLNFIKKNRILLLCTSVLILGGLLIYNFAINKNIDKLSVEMKKKELIIESNFENLEDSDGKENDREKINEGILSAKKISKEIIEVDNTLTAHYKTWDPLPSDEGERKKMFDKLEEAKVKNTLLTDAKEADHINTWQLNPKWSLKLESVINYQNIDKIPIVFSMTTESGESAGLIYAVYDVENYKLLNISRHYTSVGLEEQVI